MKQKKRKTILITGGHLSPAWATIKQLQSQGHWQIYYLGRRYSSSHTTRLSDEARLVPTIKSVKFMSLTTGRLPHRLTLKSVTDLLKFPFGWLQSFYLLFKIRPQVVLSFGGYLGLPVVVNARLLRIPIIIHEQTSTVGIANRISSPFATRIAVSFNSSLKHFPPHKTTLTGNPLRSEIFRTNPEFLKQLHHLTSRPLIYVTGGNQGARDLNLPVIKSLPKLLEKYSIIHQVGDHHLQHLSWQKVSHFQKTYPQLSKYYLPQDYFPSNQIGTVYKFADLVISRSGANTVTELAALGKPAILVPLPTAHHQEQLKNASILAKAGTAAILEEKDLTPNSLISLINKIFNNIKNYQSHAPQAKKLINTHAARNLANLIEDTLN
jgi:UDP-N-acetylglucosamine--N-acetylmuramyl-(pentapeptide) pyrophosphoryl-undecaprenol N-acetylglucosamine transferase